MISKILKARREFDMRNLTATTLFVGSFEYFNECIGRHVRSISVLPEPKNVQSFFKVFGLEVIEKDFLKKDEAHLLDGNGTLIHIFKI